MNSLATNVLKCSLILRLPVVSTIRTRSSSITTLSSLSFCTMTEEKSTLHCTKAKALASMYAERLNQLRLNLKQKHQVDAILIPTGDPHNNEYLLPRDARRSFISGFDGSAGSAVVTLNKAAMWTDGRYTLQAKHQLNAEHWQLFQHGSPGALTISQWLLQQEVKNVGVDPFTISVMEYKALCTKLKDNISITSLKSNPIDEIWGSERPSLPLNPIRSYPLEYAGVESTTKIENLREKLKKENVKGVLISALDQVAWLYNLRGSDFEFSPIFLSYAYVDQDKAVLYVESSRLTTCAVKSLKESAVEIKEYDQISKDVSSLLKEPSQYAHKLWLEPDINMAMYVLSENPDTDILLQPSPVGPAMGQKNAVELEGLHRAHVEDGVAGVKFFCWLEQVQKDGSLFKMTELDLSKKMDGFRAQQKHFMGLSFDAISAIGPNGAVIHYKPREEECLVITPDVYLLDSGGQYLGGTTDVTRTVHLGTPTAQQKMCFTRVFKGHIALARAIFPVGTRGHELEILARGSLWEVGLDYAHGTGHGVGSYLNVHERTYDITSYHALRKAAPLERGVVLSNEPGYYLNDAFGIRIENVFYTKELFPQSKSCPRAFLGFETITLLPYQFLMFDYSLLNRSELKWINEYHKNVFEKIGNELKAEISECNANGIDSTFTKQALSWLEKNTMPIDLSLAQG